jgi:hypothetical protein
MDTMKLVELGDVLTETKGTLNAPGDFPSPGGNHP